MASPAIPAHEPLSLPGETASESGAAAQRASWRSRVALSSGLGRIERFLASAAFDRAPWLAVCFACGIAAWFALPRQAQWQGLIAGALGAAGLAWRSRRLAAAYPFTRVALIAASLALAAGTGHVWLKSALVGTPGIARPFAGTVTGRVVGREDRPADDEVRLLLAMADPTAPGRVIVVRLRVPEAGGLAGVREGARIRVGLRIMPPPPPILPGGHDFARSAWFAGVAATGSALGPVTVIEPGRGEPSLARIRAALSRHIAARLDGSAGGIASALASGDRGGIAQADEEALRDAGLSHLLSVSGLHVSAVVAAAYLLAARLLALLPWLALRVRVPLCASAAAALAGVSYTLLTGAEVPTVRSMVGALLVLAAIALGREPLSLRLLALAAFAVLLAWPEAVMGPSFQLSFAAVLAIVALHGAPWLRRWSAPREEPLWAAGLRRAGLLLLTGVVIELALLPIGLFHFHRAGLLGALANVIAIPLTTFVIMPAVALALLLDPLGLGAPAWWLAAQALRGLLGLSHLVAQVPGAVALAPDMGGRAYALFLGGGLWLALWQGRLRAWGLLPIAFAAILMGTTRAPDVLVSRDGRHVAITGLVPGRLAVLRDPRDGFAQDSLNEMAGLDATPVALDGLPEARCNADFCSLTLARGSRDWTLLMSRGHDPVPLRAIAAACDHADLVVSARWLPAACRPRWVRADRRWLARSGGITADLIAGRVTPARYAEDDHGWRRLPDDTIAGRLRAGPAAPARPAAPGGGPAAAAAAQW